MQPPLAFAPVEGAEVEAEQLREPEPGQQGGGDEGKVALWPGTPPRSLAGGERAQQALGGTFALEGLGLAAGDLGLGHRCHRVADHHVLGHQEAEELVPGRPGPSDAGGAVAVGERSEAPSEHLGVELAEAQLTRRSAELGCQVGGHPRQVPAVGGLGMR